MSKVLVIGASGSLGRGVISYLKQFHDVTATYSRNPFIELGVTVKQIDITSYDSLISIESNFDVVVLIAGAMPATMKGYTPKNYIDTNITGAMNVLQYCREANIKKLIYIMTFSDVSHKFYTGEPILADDDRGLTLTGDHAVYAISKVAACDLIEHYHQEYGLQTITFRIPTVYCADNNFDYYVDGKLKRKAYVKMIESIVNNSAIEMWGNPDHSKDMPYIKDFANLINLAIEHPTAQGIFNAGTGNPISLRDLINTMIEVFGNDKPVKIIPCPEKPSQPNFTFNMTKTEKVFNYHPKWSLKNMLIDIRDTIGIESFYAD